MSTQKRAAVTGCAATQTRKKRGEWAVYNRERVEVVDGKFVWSVRPERVRVMTRAEGYAMVRHKGAMPFVVSEKALGPDA